MPRVSHICMLIILAVFFSALSASASEATIRDAANRDISVDRPYTRIISLYAAHTENLYGLGLSSQIIGVSMAETYPAQALKKPRFSYHDGPEKFLASQPDLILVRPMIDKGYPQLMARLEKSGITVVSLQPGSVEEMYAYWKILGRLTGQEAQARAMIIQFARKIERIQAQTAAITPKKRVYMEAIHTRMKTFSSGSMPLFALSVAGGINVAPDAVPSRGSNIANYGKERILARADQIDVFIAQRGSMNMVALHQIYNEPGFQIIKAIQNKQVFIIDEHIISRPVPRLYEGILQIGRILYPDIFNQIQ